MIQRANVPEIHRAAQVPTASEGVKKVATKLGLLTGDAKPAALNRVSNIAALCFLNSAVMVVALFTSNLRPKGLPMELMNWLWLKKAAFCALFDAKPAASWVVPGVLATAAACTAADAWSMDSWLRIPASPLSSPRGCSRLRRGPASPMQTQFIMALPAMGLRQAIYTDMSARVKRALRTVQSDLYKCALC